MTYFKALTFVTLLAFLFAPLPIQAVPINACMEEKCIVYFNKWKVMASAKRVLAISALAELYYNGYGTEKNLNKSIRYFRKASRYRFAYAQYRVGVFYLMEEDFIDYEEGIKYLKKAARNGHTESAFLLGVIFGTGDLGITDVGESDKWLEKALKMKHPVAQKYAGYLYRSGQVNKEHYMKVNDVISELNLVTNVVTNAATKGVANESAEVAIINTEIQWPEDPNREVITVSAPSLEVQFDYHLAALKSAAPGTLSSTGSRIRGRTCAKMFSCYDVDKEEFWRYVATQ